jgi:putative membrane protein
MGILHQPEPAMTRPPSKTPAPDALPDLPEHLPELRNDIRAAIGGKSEGAASTELSKNRTRMSEYRTGMSEERTQKSEHRTDLSEHRTNLSDARSHMANERTHLAHVRTGLALLTFGITLNRFSITLQQSHLAPVSGKGLGALRDAGTVGIGMVIAGVAILIWALWRFLTVFHQIETLTYTPPKLAVTVSTIVIIATGAISAIWLILR